MTTQERIEKLSDALYSTFTVARTSPLILANMCSPVELEAWKRTIGEHMGWKECGAEPTGQLSPDYDIYHFFDASPKENKPRTKETLPGFGY